MGRSSLVLVCCALMTGNSGCSLTQSAESSAIAEYQPQAAFVPMSELEFSLHDGQGQLPKLDPHQMRVGQHVVMLAGGERDTFLDEVAMLTKPVFGTVKQIDGDCVVLQDVMLISESRSSSGVPIVNHVPYFGRLFKNTGVARVTTPVPGELRIPFAQVQCLSELTEDRFRAAQMNGVYECIGVDFDFNIPDATHTASQ